MVDDYSNIHRFHQRDMSGVMRTSKYVDDYTHTNVHRFGYSSHVLGMLAVGQVTVDDG